VVISNNSTIRLNLSEMYIICAMYDINSQES
jgi:hypothetical protein